MKLSLKLLRCTKGVWRLAKPFHTAPVSLEKETTRQLQILNSSIENIICGLVRAPFCQGHPSLGQGGGACVRGFHYLLTACLFFLSFNAHAQNARIKIDPDRKIGEISPLIYGNFIEHLGRCVYGGIYDPESPQADEDGIRKDVLEAAKGLNVTLARYPGGNFVSNYHWQDGVGPERIPRMELAWHRLETNEFGTNEFMDFAKKLGTEPYFAVNMGTGTIEEAQNWVEYCNVEGGSYYAELRKKHGYAQPHNIKYWSLGNEMDGFWQMGHLNAEDYSKKAREAAKLMKLTDPDIKLVAAGSSNYRPNADPNEWNATILKELKDVVDYIAIHIYVGNPADNYYNFVSTPRVLDQRTQLIKGLIDREMAQANRGDRDPIYIAWDEYNVWYPRQSGRIHERHTRPGGALQYGRCPGHRRFPECFCSQCRCGENR